MCFLAAGLVVVLVQLFPGVQIQQIQIIRFSCCNQSKNTSDKGG